MEIIIITKSEKQIVIINAIITIIKIIIARIINFLI